MSFTSKECSFSEHLSHLSLTLMESCVNDSSRERSCSQSKYISCLLLAGNVAFLNHVTRYSARSGFPDYNPTNAHRDCTSIHHPGQRQEDILVGIVTIPVSDHINVKCMLDYQICLSAILRFDFGFFHLPEFSINSWSYTCMMSTVYRHDVIIATMSTSCNLGIQYDLKGLLQLSNQHLFSKGIVHGISTLLVSEPNDDNINT